MDRLSEISRQARRLTTDDAGELYTLQLAAWVREARANNTIEIPPLQEAFSDVERQLADEGLTTWGFRGGSGRLLATARTSLRDGTHAFLGRLGVVPDLHGQGLGSGMLRFAESQLPGTVAHIELFTGLLSADNHAFYGRHGYRRVSEHPDAGYVVMVKDV